MAKLIYSAITSLDGYIADQTPVEQDFAEIWQTADKVVYSTTLKRSRAPGHGSSETSTLKRSVR